MLENFDADVMSESCDAIVIFTIYSRFLAILCHKKLRLLSPNSQVN